MGDVFATMKAVFWNKTVLFFWTVQELRKLLGTRPGEQDVGPKATAIMVVFLWFLYSANKLDLLFPYDCQDILPFSAFILALVPKFSSRGPKYASFGATLIYLIISRL